MVPETTAPSEVLAAKSPSGSDPERRRDEWWATVVGSVDAWLRSWYNISEFTDDPACVFRLGVSPARAAVRLADGTVVSTGEPIGTLHFWNEHLPRYGAAGPDLRWAADMRRRVLHSLRLLAEFVEGDAGWRGVRAFCGESPLTSRLGELQLGRVTHRYGFERVPAEASLARRLHRFGECAVAWSLTRAYNPAALPRQQFFRCYNELWISRSALIEQYGRGRPADGDRGET